MKTRVNFFIHRVRAIVFTCYCSFLLLIPGFHFSQLLPIRRYSLEEGLPQAMIYTFYFDQKGYLWAGTQGGVTRFDGVFFKTYNMKDGLKDNHVTAIVDDAEGNYWIGYRYEGVSILREDTIIHPSALDQAAVGGMVEKIVPVNQKSVLILSDNGRLGSVTITKTDTGFSFHYTAFPDTFLGGAWIRDIVMTTQGEEVWFITNRNLFIVNANDFHIRQRILIKEGPIVDLMFYSERLGIFATPHEVYFLQKKKGEWVIHPSSWNKLFKNIEINSVSLLNEKEYVVSTFHHGLVWIKEEGVRMITRKNGLPSNFTYLVRVDREGNIWCAIESFGLVEILNDEFVLYNSMFKDNPSVMALMEDKRGNVWVGTEGEGIAILQGITKESTQLDYNFYNPRIKYLKFPVIGSNSINCIYQHSSGIVWISHDKGIELFSEDGRKLGDLKRWDELRMRLILSMVEDEEGNMWLTSLSNGIFRIQVDSKGFPVSVAHYTRKEGLPSNMYWTVVKHSDGSLWFGSNDHGIVIYRKGEWDHWDHTSGLPHDRPGSISIDSKGVIWVASIGGGVFALQNGEVMGHWTTKDGLSSDNPYFVFCDSADRVWVGTNSGLDLLLPGRNEIMHFGYEEGFLGIETNQNCVRSSRKGGMWVGTIKGLMYVNPESFLKDTLAPLLYLSEVRVSRKVKVKRNIKDFSYSQNYLTFFISCVFYSYPSRVKFQYRLKGLDSEFSNPTTQREITYSNLSPGKYDLEVKALTGLGIPPSYLRYSFTIRAPWYRTKLAYVFYSITGMGIFFAFFYLIRQRIRYQREIERLSLVAKETDNAIMLWDDQGRLIWANEGFQKMTGYSIEEFCRLKGTNIKDISENPEIEQVIKKCIQEKCPVEYTVRMKRKDGKWVWIKSTLTPVLSEGNLRYLISVDSDITPLRQAHEELIKAYRNIQESIDYAARLQKSLFPSIEEFEHMFPGSFILLLPKSGVSGDFYWYERVGRYLYFAACDCTGHGIPGAILTILCLELLRKGAREEQITDPGLLLDYVREGLLKTFRVKMGEELDKMLRGVEGMDCSLCIWDGKVLRFSGANNPLWIVRDEDLIEYKGDRQPVGWHLSGKLKPFNSYEIEIEEGDMLYLFSDGYSDQFRNIGGKIKKMGKKRFKTLLNRIGKLDSKEQKRILVEELNHWQGHEPQTDDIVIMGIRFHKRYFIS